MKRANREIKAMNFTRKQRQIMHDKLLIESTERCQAEPYFLNCGRMLSINSSLQLPHEDARILFRSRRCYVCKEKYNKVHHFYHQMCPTCASENYKHRNQTGNLEGKIALVTGGRIKIGYETSLKLLRAGAQVIVTTRFEKDAAYRFSQEADFHVWQNRLIIYGLDLRHVPSIEAFTTYLLDHYQALDIIINNAAQTIKKHPEYFEYLSHQEQRPLEKQQTQLLGEFRDTSLEAEKLKLIHINDDTHSKNLPTQNYNCDEFNEPVDTRATNSWTDTLESVETLELVETQVINAIAPFIINSRLKPLLKKSTHTAKFIINVSSMEGQFNRKNKTHRHPHTNMSKASLNMMTRTSASDYSHDRIYMNSVDTGWVTEENPLPMKVRSRISGKVPPLDCIDGAARILAPIFDVLEDNKPPAYGKFFKDYRETNW